MLIRRCTNSLSSMIAAIALVTNSHVLPMRPEPGTYNKPQCSKVAETNILHMIVVSKLFTVDRLVIPTGRVSTHDTRYRTARPACLTARPGPPPPQPPAHKGCIMTLMESCSSVGSWRKAKAATHRHNKGNQPPHYCNLVSNRGIKPLHSNH